MTRSINFEPVHFWEEDGAGPIHAITFLAKLVSELITIRLSDFILTITPREERIYTLLGGRGKVATLPLRSLPCVLTKKRDIVDHSPLHVFFMGSTYNVVHNRRALEMVVKEIVPIVERVMPGKFIFHILGAKMPPELMKYFTTHVIYEGYVADLDVFLSRMDIALIPSLFGAGMQQKIFEPLARGIPTITSKRGIAGYPFRDGEDVLWAETAAEFSRALLALSAIERRRALSEHALRLCNKIFSPELTHERIMKTLQTFIQ